MDNNDDARLLVEEVLDRFAFHRYVNGLNIHAALATVRDEVICQTWMYLVDIHNDLVRGISLGIHVVIEVEVATCVVVVYHLHSTFLHYDFVIYEVEKERLIEANQT
jgi:hypothetical protein